MAENQMSDMVSNTSQTSAPRPQRKLTREDLAAVLGAGSGSDTFIQPGCCLQGTKCAGCD